MIKGIIFDKDGTLFDFNATWGEWSRQMIEGESGGDPALTQALADTLGYDLMRGAFKAGSIVIAETSDTVADAMLTHLPHEAKATLIARMQTAAKQVPQVQAAPLPQLLAHMRSTGLVLGVATNDNEGAARSHLSKADILDMFDFVAGYDSGFGGKPAAGQLHAFCAATGLTAADCLMVGDSTHDLHAGIAAGMRTVGVLTGPAQSAELAPLADVVLTSIAELPAWIAAQNTTTA